MVWYFSLFNKFSTVCYDPHKGFRVLNETEVDVFLEFPCFLYDPVNAINLISVPLPFLNPACTSGSSWFTYCWSLAWTSLSITLLAWEMSATVWQFEHSSVLPFLGTEMKNDLFQSCGHCWIFQICWHMDCSTLIASSFRILNSSVGIPSSPLALLAVVLPAVHLTSHSRMLGSRWVTTPSWLSVSLKPFLYSSSMYSCHLLLICFH